ncbi:MULTISPECIES: hypothetical protein [unclassified Mesorhizobium]|uniref:hypothetical protein n=1 Tax=unclassified Mesorhizobium TaxID=325217 RepID=UPI000FD8BF2D|nr:MULTISPECIES: hypothetical protein [unclassified Mesorhizobium]TGT76721.1 hypothetical protein EN809_003705 [Mesorhizobium sp. M2E.F.Ca.ET.166.01.1.1]TGW02833.1 hypothetical protein EN797_003705 [Mesorhizobium sp. M2E.F.Ca.ET.154.01.1.1]
MNWLGDYPEDFTTVAVYFSTHDSNGAPVAPLTGFEADDVKVYKNGNAAQKTTTNGLTMTSPFDSITGLHCLVIDTSNDTGDSGFWTTGGGGVYTVVLNPDTETVNGQTVLKVIGTFGICLSPALRPTTAGRTLDVSAGGEAGIDWANIGSQTTSVVLSGTTVKTATDIETDTQDIQSRLPAALVSGRMDTSVGAMASGVLTATAIAADAIGSAELAASAASEIGTAVWAVATRELTSGANIALAKGTGITGFNDLDAAGVRGAVGLASANLDTQIDALPTNSELATALAGADDATLAAIAALNNLSAAQVKTQADQALADAGVTTTVTGRIDAAISTRLAAGSYTAPLDAAGTRSAVGLASANLDTQLGAIAGYIDTEVSAIKAKTDNLPSDPADASDIAAAFASLQSHGDSTWSTATGFATASDIPTAEENADVLLDRDMSAGTDSGSPTVRTVRQALRFLRNKWAVATGTLTVYKEDDTTESWTAEVSTDPSAEPIVSNDPASA